MKNTLRIIALLFVFIILCTVPAMASYNFNGVSVGSGYTQIDYKTKTGNQGTTYINWTSTSPASSINMTFKEMSDDNSYTYASFSAYGTSASAAVNSTCTVGNKARFKASQGGIFKNAVQIWGNWLP